MHKPPPYSELSTKNEGRIRHEERESYLVSILKALHVIKTGQWHLKNIKLTLTIKILLQDRSELVVFSE